jgi:hypothetical protein
MSEILETKLKIESWDEKPYRELPDGTRFTRADVALSGDGDGITAATFEGLMYYRADGTSSYVTLMRIEGTVGGRSGAFVLRGDGAYDGTTARGTSEIVAGTDGLAGISGTAESSSTSADYPFMPLTITYTMD